MPFYTCHKRVQALEIKEVGHLRTSTSTGKPVRNILMEGGRADDLPADMFTRYTPVPGDFLVRYEDGYESFSPRKAFLDGYTREEAIEALPERIDQALAQEPNTPFITGELQELLRDCRAEIVALRGHADGNLLMERLNDLAEQGNRSVPEPEWLRSPNNYAVEIARVARNAYVTINSLKFQLESIRTTIWPPETRKEENAPETDQT